MPQSPNLDVTEVITEGGRSLLAERLPAPHLRPYVRALQGYHEVAPGLAMQQRQLPAPQIVVIIELGPPIKVFDAGQTATSARYPGGFAAGLHDKYTLTEHAGRQSGIQINFTPIGGRLFFGVPMSELTGRVLPLEDLLPKEDHTLAARLAELADWSERLELAEALVSARIAAARANIEPVAWALREIDASGGTLDVGWLAAELGYSHRHVISLFRQHVGIPPKALCRLVRFDRLIARLRTDSEGDALSWADLAAELGYYDQAHLVREVRQFAGITPTRAFSELVPGSSQA